jgi:hypothetical protein
MWQGRENLICNCGYGHGFSVLETAGAMKAVSGIGFEVHFSGRRADDFASFVAATERIRSVLGTTFGQSGSRSMRSYQTALLFDSMTFPNQCANGLSPGYIMQDIHHPPTRGELCSAPNKICLDEADPNDTRLPECLAIKDGDELVIVVGKTKNGYAIVRDPWQGPVDFLTDSFRGLPTAV